MAEKTVTLAPGESKEILFEAIPHEVRSYRVLVDGLEGSFSAVAPPGLVLNYKNPKRGSTHWEVRVFDIANQRWTPPYTAEPIGSLRSFPELAPGNFLLWFMETYDVFFNSYEYGPLLVAMHEVGTYTWDAGAETLNGHRAINLPKSNNLCQVVGTVTGRNVITEDGESDITIAVESAADISGYLNAGQFFVGGSITARTSENTYRLVGEKITARLKMEKVPLGEAEEYGYTYRWNVRDIKFATGWPDWAFTFSGSVWRPEKTSDWDGESVGTSLVRASVSSPVGLDRFAACLNLINEETGDGYPTTFLGPNPRVTGTYERGDRIPSWYSATLWAHPDPEERFERVDYAEQRGWVRVASG